MTGIIDRSGALSRERLRRAAGHRCGLVPTAQLVPTTAADVDGVFHASVPSPWSPAGGAAWSADEALDAAIAEALERYAAFVSPVVDSGTERHPEARDESTAGTPSFTLDDLTLFDPVQKAHPSFPYAAEYALSQQSTMRSMLDDHVVRMPALVVGLGVPSELGTSNGLACGTNHAHARIRAVQEVVERDALITAWLHGVEGRCHRLPEHLTRRSGPLAAVVLVDITPAYSPWPVAAVWGTLPWRGRPRYGLGAACRTRWVDAVDKAFLEWAQATVFAGVVHTEPARPERRTGGDNNVPVRTFDDHARYYTVHPQAAAAVPFGRGPLDASPVPADGPDSLVDAVAILARRGVRLFERDLTTVDVAEAGVHVVRVVSPDLTGIHVNDAWPFLGGRTADRAWRFPDLAPRAPFPNPMPHPLG